MCNIELCTISDSHGLVYETVKHKNTQEPSNVRFSTDKRLSSQAERSAKCICKEGPARNGIDVKVTN